MKPYIFHEGQTVFFLYDPEFYDDDLEGEIAKGVITERYTQDDEFYYGITTSDGVYDRLEEDLYETFDEAKHVVDDYFADKHASFTDYVDQCKEDLRSARSALNTLNKRIKRWEAKSKQLQEELEKT